MGLAGRKEKQRIPNDPRNLSWADDANKFGAAYLQKLGWSAGSGLGASGDGRTTHIKVNQKLDMLGIGAAHQKDPNGIAWKQNKDFENLLRRLNGGGEEAEVSKIDGFAKAQESTEGEDVPAAEVADTEEGSSTQKRKRNGGEDSKERRKKSKKGDSVEKKQDKKSKKKDKKSKEESAEKAAQVESPTPEDLPQPSVVTRPFRAHRARFLASKRIASKSSIAIDEILGISRSGTSTPYLESSIPSTPLDTPSDEVDSSEQDDLKLQKLTTSTKSVMDYFKEKLLAKSNGASSSSTPISATSPSTPRDDDEDDYGDRPRGLGLGFARLGLGAGVGSSKLRSEVTFAEAIESDRIGIGMFSRLSTMVSSSTDDATKAKVTVEAEAETVASVVEVADTTGLEKKRKKEKKEKKAKTKTKSEDRLDDEEKIKDNEKTLKKSRKKDKQKAVAETLEEDPGLEGSVVEETTSTKVLSKTKKEKKSKRKADANADGEGEGTGAGEEEPRKKKKKKSSKQGDSELQ